MTVYWIFGVKVPRVSVGDHTRGYQPTTTMLISTESRKGLMCGQRQVLTFHPHAVTPV